jgi:hypothetical protein
MLQLLLQRHADVNLVNAAGLTPLDLANRRATLPMPLFASQVLRTGAPGIPGRVGRPSPGQFLNGQKAAVDLLEKAGGKRGTPRRAAGYPPGYSGPGAFDQQ